MSNADEKKKKHERNVLTEALHVARQKGGEAKRNVDRISGTVSNLEKPDLLIDAGNNHVIGIEHFRVDQYVKRDKKTSSSAAEFSNRSEKERQRVMAIDDDSAVEKEMAEVFGNQLSKATFMWRNSCVDDLLRSFTKRTLDEAYGHVPKLDGYREHVGAVRAGASIEMGFLIEVHSDLRTLIMHDVRGVHAVQYGEFPMIREVYDLLQKVSREVDWLLLAFYGGIDDNIKDAAIIHCTNGRFRMSAERQGLRPVEYLGLGKNSPARPQQKADKLTPEMHGGTIVYNYPNDEREVDPAVFYDAALSDAARAVTLTREKRPFVAKLPVQLLFELVYDRAMRSKRKLGPEDIRRYLHEMGREEVLRRMDGLAIKWGLDIEAAMQ